MDAITISDLTKRYPGKKTPALDQLNLTIREGEIFGYLGPNGAGKTTTIRLMLDFIRPTQGHVRILNRDVQQESVQVRRLVGNLPGELSLWGRLTGRQILRYLAGLRPGCDLTYAYQLAERLYLDLDVKSDNYSTGNKRKVGIIQAMMHRPPVLILDEPTNGLDPLIRNTFHDLLHEARENGQTVFLSSHVLSEVQAICDRVGILREGQLRLVEDMRTLRTNLERLVTLYSHERLNAVDWRSLPGVRTVETGHGYLRLIVQGSLDEILKQAAQFAIEDMRVEVAGLEQLFMEIYQ
ncbi:MAG: ABC transporter ATP-binding protein [Anaerolineae bacterium]